MDKNMQALAIIISFVGLITVPFIVHFLSQKQDEENRDYAKRIEIHDKKIREAREYVDAIHNLINLNIALNSIFKEETNPEKIVQRIKYLDSLHEGKLPLISGIAAKMDSIGILNDAQLTELNRLFAWHLPKISEWVKDTETLTKEDFQQKIEKAEEFRIFLLEVNNIVIKMKRRLDTLARNIK